MKRQQRIVRVAVSWLSLSIVITWADGALAHHGMDGQTPDTVLAGWLSGMAHPLLALDHLACLIALGLWQRRFWGWIGFVVASATGCALCARLGFELHVDALTAASVGVFGLALAARAALPALLRHTLVVGTGLLHGIAYGDPMHEAPLVATAAYVLGVVAMQAAVLYSTGFLSQWLSPEHHPRRLQLLGSLALLLSVALVAIAL